MATGMATAENEALFPRDEEGKIMEEMEGRETEGRETESARGSVALTKAGGRIARGPLDVDRPRPLPEEGSVRAHTHRREREADMQMLSDDHTARSTCLQCARMLRPVH